MTSRSQPRTNRTLRDHITLEVAIIGAGIAGLTAAITLRQAGHNVMVYERSGFKNEVGAAINMPPQATRILKTCGLKLPVATADKAEDTVNDDLNKLSDGQGTIVHRGRHLNFESGQTVKEVTFDWIPQRFGSPFVSFHRADLHSALRARAEELGAIIHLGCPVDAINCLQGAIKISGDSGSKQYDLIVIADGINSSFVIDIVGQDVPLQRSGSVCFRTLIPISAIKANDEASKLFLDKDGNEYAYDGISSAKNPATGAFLVAYPCRSDSLMNLAIFDGPREDRAVREDWNSPATIDDALEPLSGYHESFKALVKCADSMKAFSLAARDPLPIYARGRAMLMGDAAHPMLPTLAGGGSTALEDAAALGVLLFNIPSTDADTVPARLQLWSALRRPRDATQQILSSVMFKPQPASALKEHIQPFWDGELPHTILGGGTRPTCEFLCAYDVYKETEKAMEWAETRGWREVDVLPNGLVHHFGEVGNDANIE